MSSFSSAFHPFIRCRGSKWRARDLEIETIPVFKIDKKPVDKSKEPTENLFTTVN
jgi:hypothetical protein